MAKKLRALPFVNPSVPTLALVGAPNVGKSSLVNVLSSGTPEICNYPFTTRSIKMGHFYIDGRQHQVTDTPGLLHRPLEERNKMELLTLAALQHLPTNIIFVIDLTEDCGTSLQDQWSIREQLRHKFSEKSWIDVFSKADLLADEFAAADSSTAASSSAAETGDGDGHDTVVDAVDFVVKLQTAVRVSSLTEEGISGLQAAVLKEMLAPVPVDGDVVPMQQQQTSLSQVAQ